MGVWIETRRETCLFVTKEVTPFVGVWIETKETDNKPSKEGSHPSWVCGLKLGRMASELCKAWSHPSWVCGLKQQRGYSFEH